MGSRSKSNELKPVQNIVVSCATFETVMVTEPIVNLKADKAYIVRFVKNADDDSPYNKCFDRIIELLGEEFRLVDENGRPFSEEYSIDNPEGKRELVLVEKDDKEVYDFQKMIRTVFGILEKENSKSPDNNIYVNISSGTSEFSAAALIASMMFENVIPFSVSTKEYTIKDTDKFSDEDGNFIGLTKQVGKSYEIPFYRIEKPDEDLIRTLRLYEEEGRPSLSKMVRCLNERNKKGYGDLGEMPNLKMRFQRNYIDRWSSAGFIEKKGGSRQYTLTQAGWNAINTFYVDED